MMSSGFGVQYWAVVRGAWTSYGGDGACDVDMPVLSGGNDY